MNASENNKVDQQYRIGKDFVASACRKTSFNSVNDITEEMLLKFHPITEALLSIYSGGCFALISPTEWSIIFMQWNILRLNLQIRAVFI